MFKYFNPIWIINNFLQPSLGPEILVPAAIGVILAFTGERMFYFN